VNRHTVRLLAALCALVALPALAAASTSGRTAILSKPESGTFQMGIEPWLGYGPWRIAEKNKLFEKQGLTGVKITNFETDDQINAALAAKKLDGANIATHTALRLAAAGLPITIVLLLDESETADAILGGPKATSVKDLKGKSVAYEAGTTSDILLRYALGQNGLKMSDIKPVLTPAANAGVAALAGKVDAAVTYEPYLTIALNQKKGFKLIYSAAKDPGLIGDVFVVRNDVLAKKPGQILALVKAWYAAVGQYRSNPGPSQAIITKAVGASPGSLKTAFAGVKIYNVADAESQLHGRYIKKTILDVKRIATQAGLIKGTVDLSKLIDTKFVDAAAKG
jgi:NitT/TauT family transport system substrate-binding protein